MYMNVIYTQQPRFNSHTLINLDLPYFSLFFFIITELCRYVGVSYIRNPTDPLCKYVWCWNGHPFTMECSPGRMVHPHFYWSERDPCTELDTHDRCLLRILKGKNWITDTSKGWLNNSYRACMIIQDFRFPPYMLPPKFFVQSHPTLEFLYNVCHTHTHTTHLFLYTEGKLQPPSFPSKNGQCHQHSVW